MAEMVGDTDFTRECRDWIERGSESMERTLWNNHTQAYLLYNAPGTEHRSDTVSSQYIESSLSGSLLGLPEVFPNHRFAATLDTIERLCVEPIPIGAANAMRPDNTVDRAGGTDSVGIWPSGNAFLAANCAYHGNQRLAEEILEQMLRNLVLTCQLTWDFPQAFNTQERVEPRAGDYYWSMSMWAPPPALMGQNLA